MIIIVVINLFTISYGGEGDKKSTTIPKCSLQIEMKIVSGTK